jgi:hypothetical protein
VLDDALIAEKVDDLGHFSSYAKRRRDRIAPAIVERSSAPHACAMNFLFM